VRDLSELRKPELLRALAARVRAVSVPPTALMEVCGTHTVAIARTACAARCQRGAPGFRTGVPGVCDAAGAD